MQQTVSLYPDRNRSLGEASPDSLASMARLHLEAGNTQFAVNLLQRVLALNPRHADALHGLAMVAFQAGDLPVARDFARKATQVNANAPAYFNTLGRILAALGRHESAVKAYRKAIALEPGLSDVHVSMGIALRRMGNLDAAIASHRRALQCNPQSWVALHNLANALVARGEIASAGETYERVLQLNPASGEAQFELANLMRKLGEREAARSGYVKAATLGMTNARNWIALGAALSVYGEEQPALECFQKAVALEPANAPALYQLAGALFDRKDMDAAIEAFARALSTDGESAEGLVNLGMALRERGRREQAMACYRRALEKKPRLAEAHLNLGIVLNDYEQHASAENAFRQAVDISPNMAEAHVNLGFTLRALGDYVGAIKITRHALVLAPESAQGRNNLGLLEVETGDAPAGIAHYEQVLAMLPDYRHARSNLLMTLNYSEGKDPGKLMQAHREFEFRHASQIKQAPPARRRDALKLRIGYVSSDFRRHSVAAFAEPVLARHDRSRFEIFCYYNHLRSDDLTERFKIYADQWVESAALSDEELNERIRADGIDVLIDLNGHTANNRLLAFARKPAPVQMTWLGYPTTTGLSAIDYRITDWQVDPKGYERHNAEKPVRLASSYFCYRPPQASPPVNELPALGNGHVTFGSFNNLTKLSEATVALWCGVLNAMPDSRLLLKTKALADESVRKRVLERFAAFGIGSGRLELIGWEEKTADHLLIYNRVDIALDTWPYNGATTTCEALWMGVPVVTLEGATHAARMGKSILTAAGLDILVANSTDRYLALCTGLAGDSASLADLRRRLRAEMNNSCLMDEQGFVSGYEQAILELWRGGQ